MTKQRGFTLVEILVVISITSVLLLILTQIFFSSLRGNNKAQALAVIKQNGQSVLDSIDKSIRNADNIVCPFITPGSIAPVSSNTLVIVKNGSYTRYKFIFGQGTNGELDSDNPVPNPADADQQNPNNFINKICSSSDLLQQQTKVPMTDNSSQNGVSVVTGSFTRVKLSGFKDVVTIDFQLKPGPELDKKTFGQIDPVSFKTAVELR